MEKPLAKTVSDAEAIVRAAERAGKTLMVGHTFVYNPAVVVVKGILDSKGIGQVHYLDSQRVNLGLHQFDINVLWDLGPHDVSIALYWLDEEPEWVQCSGACFVQPDIEDVVFLMIGFPSGAIAHAHLSWLAPSKLRVLTFPRDRPIAGPLNIENTIDADSTIRQQLTLLCPSAANCIRGNLLVLPVGSSFVYVEAIFVQATSTSRIPELQRVILATQGRVVMTDSFEKSLDALFGPQQQPPPPTTSPPPSTTPPPTTTPPSEIAALVKSASDHYNAAQAALKAGDFAEYGRQLQLLEDDLAKPRAATGQ